VDGLRLDSAPAELVSPAAPALCAEGGCGAGPVLALPDVSCVQGVALGADAEPRPGVGVVTSAGSATVTDATGRYELRAPAEQAVTVFAEGYPPATVLTPAPGAGCAALDLVPPVAQTTCVSGRVVDAAGPATLATVQALGEFGVPYGPPVPTDGLGLYSLGGLPFDTPGVELRALCSSSSGRIFVATGTAPGEPGTAACTPVPEIRCGGPE
jgi:hypothetical protein